MGAGGVLEMVETIMETVGTVERLVGRYRYKGRREVTGFAWLGGDWGGGGSREGGKIGDGGEIHSCLLLYWGFERIKDVEK